MFAVASSADRAEVVRCYPATGESAVGDVARARRAGLDGAADVRASARIGDLVVDGLGRSAAHVAEVQGHGVSRCLRHVAGDGLRGILADDLAGAADIGARVEVVANARAGVGVVLCDR